ncbi:TetR/AcrR family transcriptional regulator [Roseivivax marinus]|uniref:TetR/AcrR family transcriptional regulator n=1 Tax=Roseivivax marinus TaxID=1379903 RepID=UPI001F046C74|nr:TetR/AcrR family transcriptional regulator [Roseivivax marinus]UMA66481.1 TetR/AcrR family transcriptional regulator [Roseivivax marinus]
MSLRRRMPPEARRSAILAAATELMAGHGWDTVTVSGIVDAAEISKGGFYHHFSSKDAVMEAVIRDLAASGLDSAVRALDITEGDALKRFTAFVTAGLDWESARAETLDQIARIAAQRGNDPFFGRLQENAIEHLRPALVALVRAGAAEGTFSMSDAETGPAVDLLLHLLLSRWRTIAEARGHARAGAPDRAKRIVADRLNAESALMARVLGLTEAQAASLAEGRTSYAGSLSAS